MTRSPLLLGSTIRAPSPGRLLPHPRTRYAAEMTSTTSEAAAIAALVKEQTFTCVHPPNIEAQAVSLTPRPVSMAEKYFEMATTGKFLWALFVHSPLTDPLTLQLCSYGTTY